MIFCLSCVNEIIIPKDDTILDECIKKIAQNDKVSLSKLYEQSSKSVYAFALSILKNTSDAEDVMHDVYISIYNNAKSYKSNAKPMAWIITITKNLCLMKLRQRKRQSDIPQEDWEKYLDKKQDLSLDDKETISFLMKKLKDDERQIVILHAVSGFKHKEIASIMNLRLSTVLSKYNRALKKLKELMGGEWQ